MKIREVIYEESFLDKIKKAFKGDEGELLNPDAPFGSRVTKAENDPQMDELAKATVRLWMARLQRIEKQNQGPLNASQYERALTEFVNGVLLGRYSLDQLSREAPEAARLINQAIDNITNGRDDAGVWRNNFRKISAAVGTIVLAMPSDADRNKLITDYPGWTYDPKDRTYNSGEFKFRADDPQQMALVKQLSQKLQQAQ